MRCEIAGALMVCCLLLAGACRSALAEDADAGFPFAIPYDGLAAGTAPALLARLESPAGAGGFVQVVGDRFVLSESRQPIRFWGTNLCFAGDFPPHDVAERMAARLASLGINCVRFHHMDANAFPRGIWAGSGGGDIPHGELSPEALDRLDFLVAQLKRNGVYADLNLHVSRQYGTKDGFPAPGPGETMTSYSKGMDIFYPRAIEEQKRYARMLLRHVNAYTGSAYAEEPAVAIVEINNEDGLIREWAGGGLDRMPAAYADELQRQWNAWLAARYATTDGLRTAWSAGEQPGSDVDLLAAPGVRASLQTIGDARAEVGEAAPGEEGRLIRVEQADSVGWHVQYMWAPLAVQKGQPYVLRIRLRANRDVQVGLNCMMAHDPWTNLGLNQNVQVTPQWQEHEFYFTATADEAPGADGGGARVTVSGLSQEGLELAIGRASLQEASVTGLPPDETLDGPGVKMPQRTRLTARTPAVQRDVASFLRDTELGYWRGMRDYLHGELGVRMPVTGSAVGYVTPYVAAETVDFVDSHAYWRHPSFPGRPWDPSNWIVRNDPMVDVPDRSTIASLAARRVFGLPFTVTEYNHPQPQHYAAEGFPLVAVYGSFQGWDGLFEFAYSHDDHWEVDHFANFFDLKADPVKLALMPACSDMLRNGRVTPPQAVAVGRLPLERRLALIFTHPLAIQAYTGGAGLLDWEQARLGIAPDGTEPPAVTGSPADVQWEVRDGNGLVRFVARSCAGLIGFANGQAVTAGGLTLLPGATALNGFSVVMVNSVGGQALGEPGRCLITAVTRCWNRDMGWNAERNSVGRNWGEGPTMCEGVPVTLRADVAGQPVRIYALKPDGSRGREVPAGEDGRTFELNATFNTLWYELVIGD